MFIEGKLLQCGCTFEFNWRKASKPSQTTTSLGGNGGHTSRA